MAKIRGRYARVEDIAGALAPEIERLIDEYLEMLRPVLGDALDDPTVKASLIREVATLAFKTVLTNTLILDAAQEALSEGVEETNPVGYLYVGPDEDVIAPGGYRLPRPFCDVLVGSWLPREDINRLNNRQIANPFVSRGGYNCRHQWHPIYADEVEEFDQADVRRANAAAGRRR